MCACSVLYVGRTGALACSSVGVFVSVGARPVAEVCTVSHQCHAAAGIGISTLSHAKNASVLPIDSCRVLCAVIIIRQMLD